MPFQTGPIHAIREAVGDGGIFSTGTMFLNADKKLADKINSDSKSALFIRTWCFYGSEEDGPWAAVSLWRGLGLIGQLLKLDIDPEEEGKSNEKIKNLLDNHFQSALVVRRFPRVENLEKKWTGITFKKWESPENNENFINKLANELLEWLKDFYQDKDKDKDKKKEKRINLDYKKDNGNDAWKSCFVRRMHGESIMSLFFQYLDRAYFRAEINDWTARFLINEWREVLEYYWKDYRKEGCKEGIGSLLKSCPVFTHFLNEENEVLDIYRKGKK